jgi:septum site-determining protein MinD
VAVLDADLGMPNVGTFLSLDAPATLHDVLAGQATTAEATVEIGDGLGFVLGDRSLGGFADADPAGLDAVVDALAERYRYVLVDTGGGLSYEGVYPMELADAIVLVTSPVPAAISDTEKSAQLADRLGVPVRGVVVTHTVEDTRPESIASELDVDFLGSVPTDDAIVESAAKRQPVIAYAPESAATVAYYRIAERLRTPGDAPLEPLDTATKPPDADPSSPGDREGSARDRSASARTDPDAGDASAPDADADDDADTRDTSAVPDPEADGDAGDTNAESAETTETADDADASDRTRAETSTEGDADAGPNRTGATASGDTDGKTAPDDTPGVVARILDRFRLR